MDSAAHTDTYHTPVLMAECLRFLNPQPGEKALDATLGGGGHSEAIAQHIRPGGTLVGLDRDPQAIAYSAARLQPLQTDISIILRHAAFGKLEDTLHAEEATRELLFDAVIFDLGVSSYQLEAARGFSFRRDEPLDMRMDPTAGQTAAQMLAGISEAQLRRVLIEYGEERWAGRIARALVEERERGRPITTTGQLAALVERSVPRRAWPPDTHVATRTFQAARIFLNNELDQLRQGLQAALTRMRPGGRIVVISFHSLEDRIVKQFFAAAAGKAPSAPGSSPAAFLSEPSQPTLELLTRKPVSPASDEIARNPRARSARLRAARRIAP